jgi:hypothetical protein
MTCRDPAKKAAHRERKAIERAAAHDSVKRRDACSVCGRRMTYTRALVKIRRRLLVAQYICGVEWLSAACSLECREQAWQRYEREKECRRTER